MTEPNLTKKEREYLDLIERIARHNNTSPEQVLSEAKTRRVDPNGEDASSVPLTAPAPVDWSRGEFERKVVQRLTVIAVFTGIVGVPAAIYVGVVLAAFLVTAVSRG